LGSKILMTMSAIYEETANWMNENQGLLSTAIFVLTLLIGWFSGIFSALRRKPKFKITTIEGPTFCCTYNTGKKHNGFDVHRTGVALYLSISNVGSAASSLGNIAVGYHWNIHPFSLEWMRYALGWFWLTEQSIALEDFQVHIGNSIKVFPFLLQKNSLLPSVIDNYLEVGRIIYGVVYFEQDDSWGGCFPKPRYNKVKVKIRVKDVFGGSHTKTIWIPSLSIEEARKFNPSFGNTFASLKNEPLPHDELNNNLQSPDSPPV